MVVGGDFRVGHEMEGKGRQPCLGGRNNFFRATLDERILRLHCCRFLAMTQTMTSSEAGSLRC
jgi:hypothetical protein